jgi:Cytochrome D1 heme domain
MRLARALVLAAGLAFTSLLASAQETRSADGRVLLIVQAGPPPALALRDATSGALLACHAAATLDGRRTSRIGALHDNSARRSFIVALPEIAELWEISYDPNAEPIYDGLVHDWRLGEGLARAGTYGVRRTRLEAPIERFELDAQGIHVIDSDDRSRVINLDIRRAVPGPAR